MCDNIEKKQVKTIFGDVALVPASLAIAFSLDLSSVGDVKINYGVQTFYLKVTFRTSGSLEIVKKYELATGTDGYGDSKPYKSELFWYLHKNGFPEAKRKELTLFLLKKYEEGEVKVDAMIDKIDSLLK